MGPWTSLELSSPCHGEDRGFKSHRARLWSAEADLRRGEARFGPPKRHLIWRGRIAAIAPVLKTGTSLWGSWVRVPPPPQRKKFF